MYPCHNGQGNQYFRYDLETQQLHHGTKRRNHCVDTDLPSKLLFIAKCDESSVTQKWKWAKVNETMLKNQVEMGAKFLDVNELNDLN